MKLSVGSTLVLLVALLPCAFSRTFTRCEVAREMYTAGYSMESLPDWMCLVNSESAFNSSAIGGPNTNGSSDWGLFQVNDNYWCTLEGVGKDCNINCQSNERLSPSPFASIYYVDS